MKLKHILKSRTAKEDDEIIQSDDEFYRPRYKEEFDWDRLIKRIGIPFRIVALILLAGLSSPFVFLGLIFGMMEARDFQEMVRDGKDFILKGTD